MTSLSHSLELPFSEIHRNRSIPKSFEDSVRKAYSVNQSFFKQRIPFFNVIICETPSEWRKYCKYYHFPYASGIVLRDATMVVKSPAFLRKAKSLSSFPKLVMHEMNHVFWVSMHSHTPVKWSPIWLVEGLACYVGKGSYILSQKKLRALFTRVQQKPSLLPYRYTSQLIPNIETMSIYYSLWYYFTTWLINKYGRGVILKIIKKHSAKPSKQSFYRTFHAVCGASLMQEFLEFRREMNL